MFGWSGRFSSNADLVEQVEDALLDDEHAPSHGIEIAREGGIIYLRGFAPNARAREAATRVVARVPGVQAVVNEMEVRRRAA